MKVWIVFLYHSCESAHVDFDKFAGVFDSLKKAEDFRNSLSDLKHFQLRKYGCHYDIKIKEWNINTVIDEDWAELG